MPEAAGDITAQSWSSLGQAPVAFWIVVGAVVLGLAVFSAWTYFSGRVPRSINPATLGGVVGFLIIWTFVLYLVPAMTAMSVAPTERTWAWAPGEVLTDPGGSGLTGEPYRGYELAIVNNCAACHTLYVRPQDLGTGWAEGVDGSDVATASDYLGMPSPPLGTQRNGPDLSFIGRRIPDMTYQIDHLKEPRKYKPDSIMPTYRHLSERDLRDLAAFLVTLGNSKAELLAGGGGTPVSAVTANAAALNEKARRGAELYRTQGCVGCHSIDGRANVGPTWKGLWGKEERLEGGGTVVVDEEYVRTAIVDAGAQVVAGYPAVMPSYKSLSDEEIDALIEFIRTLE